MTEQRDCATPRISLPGRWAAAGDAVLQRDVDGTVRVLRADPLIRVSRDLLADPEPWVFVHPSGTVIQLDTAGEYRYELVGAMGRTPASRDDDVLVYRRTEEAG